jgi:hypothetical protein
MNSAGSKESQLLFFSIFTNDTRKLKLGSGFKNCLTAAWNAAIK